jgi:hypothetical protein
MRPGVSTGATCAVWPGRCRSLEAVVLGRHPGGEHSVDALVLTFWLPVLALFFGLATLWFSAGTLRGAEA